MLHILQYRWVWRRVGGGGGSGKFSPLFSVLSIELDPSSQPPALRNLELFTAQTWELVLAVVGRVRGGGLLGLAYSFSDFGRKFCSFTDCTMYSTYISYM
jgi:hypothetical protein